jgi:hypothetical protein
MDELIICESFTRSNFQANAVVELEKEIRSLGRPVLAIGNCDASKEDVVKVFVISLKFHRSVFY